MRKTGGAGEGTERGRVRGDLYVRRTFPSPGTQTGSGTERLLGTTGPGEERGRVRGLRVRCTFPLPGKERLVGKTGACYGARAGGGSLRVHRMFPLGARPRLGTPCAYGAVSLPGRW
jgi:hypothetical protein